MNFTWWANFIECSLKIVYLCVYFIQIINKHRNTCSLKAIFILFRKKWHSHTGWKYEGIEKRKNRFRSISNSFDKNNKQFILIIKSESNNFMCMKICCAHKYIKLTRNHGSKCVWFFFVFFFVSVWRLSNWFYFERWRSTSNSGFTPVYLSPMHASCLYVVCSGPLSAAIAMQTKLNITISIEIKVIITIHNTQMESMRRNNNAKSIDLGDS